MKIKNDQYRRARGGWSRILDISCSNCGRHISYYQKDGPGPLKRMYIDRMAQKPSEAKLTCDKCKTVLGIKSIYKKEKRAAYELKPGSVSKKIIKAREVDR